MSRANEPNYFKGFTTGQPSVDDWFKPVQPAAKITDKKPAHEALKEAIATTSKYNCDTCEDSGEDVLLEEGQEVKLSASWNPWKRGKGKPLELLGYTGPLELYKVSNDDNWLKVVFIPKAGTVNWYSDSAIIAWRKSNG